MCVCSIHQNAILLVDALDVQADYKELMSKLVCSPEYSECMIHRCEKCPGSENLRKYIDTVICEKDEQVCVNHYLIFPRIVTTKYLKYIIVRIF